MSVVPLQAGSNAPDFDFVNAEGERVSTASLRGRPYVVYFYPKDNTPGCTKEACGFRDAADDYADMGVLVIGVSPDSDASHAKFRAKHQLGFGLASDEDKAIARAFGVWGPKKFMGREYEGVHRTTFLVDERGEVKKVYERVRPAGHAEQILKDLK